MEGKKEEGQKGEGKEAERQNFTSALLLPTLNPDDITTDKLCYCSGTTRRAMSVEIWPFLTELLQTEL